MAPRTPKKSEAVTDLKDLAQAQTSAAAETGAADTSRQRHPVAGGDGARC